MNIIYKESIENYDNVILHGQAIWRYYAPLTDYIKANLGELEADLFAEPMISDGAIRGNAQALWGSSTLSKESQVLTSLSSKEQQKYYSILYNKLEKLEAFSKKLIQSGKPDDVQVGELIKGAVQIPDLEHVLVEGDEVVLVAWGFTHADKGAPFNLKSTLELSPTLLTSYTEEDIETIDEDLVPVVEQEKKNEDENTIKENSEKELEQHDKESKFIEEDNEKELEQHDNKKDIIEEDNKENISRGNGQNKRNWFKDNSRWLLLLLILLLIILYYLFNKKEQPVLPEQPNIIIPIDTTKIISDPDSLKKIISNRLNIALIGTNNSIQKFAKVFKSVYQDDNYKIIYYDTFTYRLQIQVPENLLIKTKDELPSKLPGFEMLIWHESVFERKTVPKDPGFGEVQKTWQYDVTQTYDAWDITQGDSNLIIAIIDDGFDLAHPELQDRIYKPWNVLTHSSNVNTGLNSKHGTHVAGIALASMNNGHGIAGVAPNCKLMPVQVGDYHGRLSSTAIIDGVLYAIRNGAKVINLSLGLKMDSRVPALSPQLQEEAIHQVYLEEEKFWTQLFKIAHDKNISVVLAGGNQNIMIGIDPMQRSPYTINVSAITPQLNKASFSNYGKYSTISAPGVQIYSSIPKNAYDYYDGTSMAAPMVAGAVALLRSVNPVLQTKEIVDILQSTGASINQSDGYVGNLMQLGVALNVSNKNRGQMPKVDCPEMQTKIDSLLIEIEKIKALCSNSNTFDTLRILPGAKDFSFAIGRWKSTTYIYSGVTGEKVTLYFDFNQNGTGTLTLLEPDNTRCTASLSMTLQNNQFSIDQLESAECYPPPTAYNKYHFECQPDNTGCVECSAQNKSNKANYFKFRLIRIKNLNF
jgi:subtilisin family serine protease